MSEHLFIPDAQIRPGVCTDHLEALGNYIVDKQPDVLINIGDFADMASLSSYERPGSKHLEGMRYDDDVGSTKEAMERLLDPIKAYNKQQRKNKKALYRPRMVMTLGNHENRINRAINADPVKLEGTIGISDLKYEKYGWEQHDFLDIVEVDGVLYSHYFVNPQGLTGHAIGGTIENKLRLLGNSFSMGHQQHRQYGSKYLADGTEIHGLVCGSFYMHDEEYLGPQKNRQYWRGVVVKHEVQNGSYDPMFVSLDYLLRNYL